MSRAALPSKDCLVCGRRMTWRKRWANNWAQVRYCSDACRRRGARPEDQILEEAILQLLDQRRTGATLCPSEVARHVRPDDWKTLMEPVRCAARRLVTRGALEITQGGRPVDPSRARGAIRLRLPPA